MSLIYDDIKKGLPADPSKFQKAYEDLMEAGSDVVILACTELSVFKKESSCRKKLFGCDGCFSKGIYYSLRRNLSIEGSVENRSSNIL